jgi:hypothetical protein
MPKRHYDEDDDRPRARRHRDEDDDHRRPRRTHKAKKKKSNAPLIIGLVAAGVVVLGGGAVAAVLLLGGKDSAPPPADPFAGMLAHWSFDDATETTVPDHSKRGNDGVFNGGRFVPGKKGSALFLEGRPDQYVDVSKAKDLNFANGAEFTIAAWFQAREKYAGTIVSFRHSTLPCQLDLYVRDNRIICIASDDTATDGKHIWKWAPAPTASDGQWHHAAFTRKAQFIELFYDGVSQGKTADGKASGPITTDLRAIGCNLKFVEDEETRFGRPGFRGAIDEVYVFSRAFSESEIQALMRR